ncbi:MAG TPA: hypothetical protein VED63_04435, partial [Acidimicrobiales bacterium]|nr:hypothetical protein [Acidimicrobiales bacterium]
MPAEYHGPRSIATAIKTSTGHTSSDERRGSLGMGVQLAANPHHAMAKRGRKRTASSVETRRNAVRARSTAGTGRAEKAKKATVTAIGRTITAMVVGSWKSGDCHSPISCRIVELKVT